MFGDFSRDSFDACRQYTRVLMQQGRPLTDADWNEQVSALWNHIYALGAATIGWHGSPDQGFDIKHGHVNPGSYFVDGIRCVNGKDLQIDVNKLSDRLIYLDVWEHTTNAIEDPNLLEPALSGIDTANRSKIVWVLRYTDNKWTGDPNTEVASFRSAIGYRTSMPALKVRRAPSSGDRTSNACQIGNGQVRSNAFTDRLYRVEIHKSGKHTTAAAIDNKSDDAAATFKWSRDNGSTVGAIQLDQANGIASSTFQLDRNRFHSRSLFQKEALVELMSASGWSVNDKYALLRIADASSTSLTVKGHFSPIIPDTGLATSLEDDQTFYYLRQWDFTPSPKYDGDAPMPKPGLIEATDGAAYVLASAKVWLELESGLQIQFSEGDYRSGDYWLIRTTADGQVIILTEPSTRSPAAEVPADAMRPEDTGCGVPPRGRHHFAPLQMTSADGVVHNYSKHRYAPLARKYLPINEPNIECPPCRSGQPSSTPALTPATPAGSPDPKNCCTPIAHVSLPLSREGTIAMRGYFGATRNLARHFPARFLQYEPKSPTYRRFRSPLLVSDILESSFEKYLAKVERCVQVTESERPLVDADARADYEQATQFQSGVSADDRFTSPIA